MKRGLPPYIVNYGIGLEKLDRLQYAKMKGSGVYNDWLVATVVQGLKNTIGIPFGYVSGALAPSSGDLNITLPVSSSSTDYDTVKHDIAHSMSVRLEGSAAYYFCKPLTGESAMEPYLRLS
jgi:hypothetical protein